MGGRIAEEVFMNQMTTGASNDFEQATNMARNMVVRWGMSDSLGPRVYGQDDGEVFLGRDMTSNKNISDSMAEKVDEEINRIIGEEYVRAEKVIKKNKDKIEVMAKYLLDWETLNALQIEDIMNGGNPRPPEDNSSKTPKPKKVRKRKIKPQVDKPASDQA
jgi:cell division protease FtsH